MLRTRFSSLVILCMISTIGSAQEVSLPVNLQYNLINKSIHYIKNNSGSETDQKMALLYQSKNNISYQIKETMEVLSRSSDFADGPVRLTLIDVGDNFNPSQLNNYNLVYITPLRAYDLKPVIQACQNAGILSVSSMPLKAEDDIVMGFDLVNSKPKIQINVASAKKSKIIFSAAFLKMAQLVE